MTEWIYELMNDRKKENFIQLRTKKWSHEPENERTTERKTELTNDWINKWMNEWTNKVMTSCALYCSSLALGQPAWTRSQEVTQKNWTLIEGLEPEVTYEMRVIARNGDDIDSPETAGPVKPVRIGVKRGQNFRDSFRRSICAHLYRRTYVRTYACICMHWRMRELLSM